ncbi:hypothetical protein HBA54_18680 [Pelagibius litoralis]|uniref:PAS domain-containing protein n=1 Tax=Pelagibius litoralis TaxID=374515 RepID=A0A967F054_9PROT|nr:hypothetical protein [Pelagibius litoralis]NIA70627.1 hypothetical protein [Pelagibius litoralis]
MSYQQISVLDVPETHPVAAFAAFWTLASNGGSSLPWSAFDPAQHKDLLPWVLLLKRDSDADPALAQSWSYAICGTGCTELFGRDYQGKTFGQDLPKQALVERKAEIDQLIAGSGPLFSHAPLPCEGREFVQVFRAAFAFCDPAGMVDRLLFVVAREDERLP